MTLPYNKTKEQLIKELEAVIGDVPLSESVWAVTHVAITCVLMYFVHNLKPVSEKHLIDWFRMCASQYIKQNGLPGRTKRN